MVIRSMDDSELRICDIWYVMTMKVDDFASFSWTYLVNEWVTGGGIMSTIYNMDQKMVIC